MKNFIHKDYLLTTDFARELYHRFAENEPIIDYHCHLPPREIAEDRRWKDISEVWLGGDHYKWRQMRSNGVDEEFCTGSASGHDKFVKYAETMEKLVKNPLFDWSHLELKRYFGVSERLCAASAERIWRKCNAVVAKKDFSARSLMVKSNVKAVCTTDDPDDDLAWHQKIARSFKGVRVLPTWRPDRILKEALKKKKDPMKHLAERHDYFAKHGCVLSDYGITAIPPKGRLQDYLVECMKLDAKAGWASQLHFNCIRNPNSRMFRKLGPDTGFDFIGEAGGLANLAELFDRLEREDLLPKTIVYSLNPSDFAALGSSSAAPGGSTTTWTACATRSPRWRRSAASGTSSACSPTRARSSPTPATSTSAASSARRSARRWSAARSRPTSSGSARWCATFRSATRSATSGLTSEPRGR